MSDVFWICLTIVIIGYVGFHVADNEEMIQPGDRRHPCPICGRRIGGMNFRPCAPVPVSQAYVERVVDVEPAPALVEEIVEEIALWEASHEPHAQFARRLIKKLRPAHSITGTMDG